uniref:Protein kinase domain-containing protein n=1 Tax=Panagrolaimus davidi TaxID=227884 RepID=A0A914PEY9_9BILA
MDSTLFNFRRQESRRFDGEKGSEFIGILFHQFLSGLQYLHQPNLRLIHRDLSSNNILIKKLHGHNYNYCLKIADLGMARQLPFWDDADLTKSIGTMPYRAPEIRISTHYGTVVDMWSSGCILYEMITGKILFPTRKQDRLMLHIARMIPITDEEFSQLPWHLQENILINEIDWTFDLLNKEIQEYGSSWNQNRICLNQYNELLHRLLSFNPAKRFTAEQILKMPIWNYLRGCQFYNPALLNHVTSLPYIEEYNNNGTTVEWRKRLFKKIVAFRAMQDLNNE